MADVYMYADETGDLSMTGAPGASTYFGFGTAVFRGPHADALWAGFELRCRLERRGVRVPRGLHAKNDSHATRDEVFDLIAEQGPRFDTTFLYKPNAYQRIVARGPMYLYKMAWYLHFKEIARQVSDPGDTLYVVAATLTTSKKVGSARDALDDVCSQVSGSRRIVLCVWDAPSSWGVQVADYGLWAVQRDLEGRPCSWLVSAVQPTLATRFTPWGAG